MQSQKSAAQQGGAHSRISASKVRAEGAVAMVSVVMVNRGSAKRASHVNRVNPAKAAVVNAVIVKSEPSARSARSVKRDRSNARNVLQRAGKTVVQTGDAHVRASAAICAVKTMARASEWTTMCS